MSHKLETEKLIRAFFGDIIKEADRTNKSLAAQKFKISIGAVDSAYYLAGRFSECSPSYLERRQKGRRVKPTFIPTWEQIIGTIPDKATLAFLLIDGITERIAKLAQENKELTLALSEQERKYNLLLEDRKKLFIAYNEVIAQKRTGGHFTLDEAKHILIPKER